jgi:hypothetical protein
MQCRGWASLAVCAALFAISGCTDAGDLSVGDLRVQAPSLCSLPPPQADYCERLPRISAPLIDGQLDCGLELQPVSTKTRSFPSLPLGTSAEYAAAFSAEGLYYFVKIRKLGLHPANPDDLLFCGDAVQLFADSNGQHPDAPNYDVPGTAQFVIRAPAPDQRTARVGSVYVYAPPETDTVTPWSSSSFVAMTTEEGYVVEALVTGADLGTPLWQPRAGQHAGFNVWICVGGERISSNDCGNRVNDFGLRLAPGDALVRVPHFDTRAFCDPILVD